MLGILGEIYKQSDDFSIEEARSIFKPYYSKKDLRPILDFSRLVGISPRFSRKKRQRKKNEKLSEHKAFEILMNKPMSPEDEASFDIDDGDPLVKRRR